MSKETNKKIHGFNTIEKHEWKHFVQWVGGEKNDDNNLVYACMGVKERFAGPDHIEYKNNKLHKVPNKKQVHTSKMKME